MAFPRLFAHKPILLRVLQHCALMFPLLHHEASKFPPEIAWQGPHFQREPAVFISVVWTSTVFCTPSTHPRTQVHEHMHLPSYFYQKWHIKEKQTSVLFADYGTLLSIFFFWGGGIKTSFASELVGAIGDPSSFSLPSLLSQPVLKKEDIWSQIVEMNFMSAGGQKGFAPTCFPLRGS